MKPRETKILADRHLRQEKQREGQAQFKYGSHIQEWFRPKMRKAAQELSAEARIRAIRPVEREKRKGTVITVGEGRGFVVEHRGEHLVVTASHNKVFAAMLDDKPASLSNGNHRSFALFPFDWPYRSYPRLRGKLLRSFSHFRPKPFLDVAAVLELRLPFALFLLPQVTVGKYLRF